MNDDQLLTITEPPNCSAPRSQPCAGGATPERDRAASRSVAPSATDGRTCTLGLISNAKNSRPDVDLRDQEAFRWRTSPNAQTAAGAHATATHGVKNTPGTSRCTGRVVLDHG